MRLLILYRVTLNFYLALLEWNTIFEFPWKHIKSLKNLLAVCNYSIVYFLTVPVKCNKHDTGYVFIRFLNRLEAAKGLESDHDDPNLSQEIYSTLSRLVENVTPDDLKTDMKGMKCFWILL